MKDAAIFALLLLTLAGSALLAATDRSRKASVQGTFAPEFTGINYKWAYLRADKNGEILDSCLILEHKFTLSGEVPDKDFPCRITFSKQKAEIPIRLAPRHTVNLTLSANTTSEMDLQIEEAIEDALARLDSAGLTIPTPDSLQDACKPRL